MRYITGGFGVLLLILIVVMAQPSNKQPTPANQNNQAPTDRAGDPRAAATEGLQSFRSLVDDQNFRDLGFESKDEISSATLGDPVSVYLVRLDQLREFQPEADPHKLITATTEMIYPVMVKDQARSSITLTQEGGKWVAAGFGGAKLIRQLAKVRANLGASESTPGKPDMFVKVPALNVYFVARPNQSPGGELTLTPLTDQPDYRMKEGGGIPAKEAFSALVPAAKLHDGKTS